MARSFRTLSASLLIVTLAACGSARLVRRDQAGGTYALEGNREKAMEAAQQEMARHCGPAGYQIVSEGEVVIGQDTSYGENTEYGENTQSNPSGTNSSTQGGSSTSGGSSTRNATEWQVVYQCGGAAPAAPPPGV